VASASSEETSDIVPLNGSGYSVGVSVHDRVETGPMLTMQRTALACYSCRLISARATPTESLAVVVTLQVAFDPLDGSSIIDANFAVGSIFGVWPGSTPLGSTGAQQAAAAYSVYGPRTLLVIARPGTGANAGAPMVQEFALSPNGKWSLHRAHVSVGSRVTVAPANLRAAAGNAAYKALVDAWIVQGCKLRYSGGMVPDVHHVLAKGGGVFCNPTSPAAPAKLRLLYECAPLAYIMEAAGGASHDGTGSILDLNIADSGARSQIALGSKAQVEQCLPALMEGAAAATASN